MTIEEIQNEYLSQTNKLIQAGVPVPELKALRNKENVSIETKLRLLHYTISCVVNQIECATLVLSNSNLEDVPTSENIANEWVGLLVVTESKEHKDYVLSTMKDFILFTKSAFELMEC